MKKTSSDILKMQGVMARGYGIIPKLPMQDINLTIEAKAIYAYFRSYAGAGTTAFPSRSKILHDLQIGENRFYKHFDLLKKHGYLKVEQSIDSKGRFKHNVYTLIENIVENSPFLENEGAEPYPHFPCTDNPDTDDRGTNNNNNKNNNFNTNTIKVSSCLVCLNNSDNKYDETRQNETQTHKKKVQADSAPQEQNKRTQDPTYSHYNAYRSIIQEHIEYADLVASTRDNGFLDNILGVMVDVMITKSDKMVKIGNEFKPFSVLQSVIMKLTRDHVELVIEKFKEQNKPIQYKTAYLRTMLYNVYNELDAHYTNQIRVDYQSANTEEWLAARSTE